MKKRKMKMKMKVKKRNREIICFIVKKIINLIFNKANEKHFN